MGKYACLCGFHVHMATMVIAIIAILFYGACSLTILLSFAQKTDLETHEEADQTSRDILLAGVVVNLFLYILLLVGNRARISFLYIPFVIIKALTIFLELAIAVVIIIHGIKNGAPGPAIMVVAFGICPELLFSIYLFVIVNRDYKYVKST